eukprot:GHVP01060920.1.p1 GENE.GHVP01060920.1~~GHVP01060920.1.p1  ORF type:complete len:518 (-),score=99.53 GHVP01060920.1:602-2155(-)
MTPSSAKKNIVSKYSQNISDFSWERLEQEPNLLAEASSNLRKNLEDFAVENWKVFYESYEIERFSLKVVSDMQKELDSTWESLENFTVTQNNLGKSTLEIQKILEKLEVSETLIKKVADFLSLPKMASWFADHDNYQTAEDICNFGLKSIKTFLSRGLSEIATDQSNASIVALKMQSSLTEVRNTILVRVRNRLASEISMSECIGLFSLLKILNPPSTTEVKKIAEDFLDLRFQFIEKQKTAVETLLKQDDVDPSIALRQVIDILRIHIFELGAQIHAFYGGDGHTSTSLITVTPSKQIRLFRSWLIEHVNWSASIFRFFLSHGKKEISMSTVFSLHRQAHQASLSLSRQNSNFFPIIFPVFVNAASNIIQKLCLEAATSFKHDLESSNFDVVNPSAIELDEPLKSQLCLFRPLASLANKFILFYNQYRQFALPSISWQLENYIKETLAYCLMLVEHKANSRRLEKIEITKEHGLIIIESLWRSEPTESIRNGEKVFLQVFKYSLVPFIFKIFSKFL